MEGEKQSLESFSIRTSMFQHSTFRNACVLGW